MLPCERAMVSTRPATCLWSRVSGIGASCRLRTLAVSTRLAGKASPHGSRTWPTTVTVTCATWTVSARAVSAWPAAPGLRSRAGARARPETHAHELRAHGPDAHGLPAPNQVGQAGTVAAPSAVARQPGRARTRGPCRPKSDPTL